MQPVVNVSLHLMRMQEHWKLPNSVFSYIMGLTSRIGKLIIVVFCASSMIITVTGYNNAPVKKKSKVVSTPKECARACVHGEEPKICYYQFTVEYYSTMSGACDFCRPNATTRLTEDCQCIMADGYEMSGIISANRMYPGPAIIVCLNDIVIVDVRNHLHGNGITIHWHGLFQKDYQYYDGVPYVTQCPIQEGAIFRYRWRADNSGTHFWHAHTGLHKADGLEGSLIVREPHTTEPNSHLWDFDDDVNIIFLTDWFHNEAEGHFPGNRFNRTGLVPDNLLINGMGRYTDPVDKSVTAVPLSRFTVKPGYRYRFRMINSLSSTCPVILSVEDHNLTVIASDGENIKPVVVNSITSFSAERYDFIINADKTPMNYWIQLRGLGACSRRSLQQFGILHYESARSRIDAREQPTYNAGVPKGVILNDVNVQCNGPQRPANSLCISNLRSARRVEDRILKAEPDVKLYLPIKFHVYSAEDAFHAGIYRKYFVGGGSPIVGMLANISNVMPPSPLLTQRADIPDNIICSAEDASQKCRGLNPCECVHVEKFPLGALVEIVLVDEAQIPGMSHPFHLHGYTFHVIGHGCGSEYNISKINVKKAKGLDERGQMIRHLKKPAAKDTYAVPNNGFTIIRFIADNPGYWLFHCHYLFHLISGMGLIFQVGEASDLPPIPKGFPRCGNFAPQIFLGTSQG